ncbi:MAG TPA: Ig-like domain-containing protein, partial [Gammaproteobacteria bacterium]|nr:Ig-like domain-containing protein [Gammaproteobacteria bacterium]
KFNAVAAYSVPGVQVAVGDVNGDGTPDLLVADYSRGNVDVLLGISATPGTFLSPITYGAGAGISSVQLIGLNGSTDINNDGNVDIVTTDAINNSVSVMLGNGAGAFLSNAYPVEFNPRSVAVANLANRFYDAAKTQPISDLIVANHGSNTITVLQQVAGAVANDTAPVAADQTLVVPDGKFPGSGELTATDADSTAALSFGVVQQPGNGTVTVVPADGFYEYQANSQFAGSDSFVFQVSDGVKLSNKATVNISVQTNSSVTSGGGTGDFGLLPGLLLLPFLRRRRVSSR